MTPPKPPAVLRIGELSRRVGVSDHVLRAWETRYGLLKPARSAGGYRLYSEDDELRVRRMLTHLESGLAAAQAARAAVDEQLPRATRAAADTSSTEDIAGPRDGAVAIDASHKAGLANHAD